MKKIILLFLLLPTLSISKDLTPSLIYHLFPLCKISSSFGQECKSLNTHDRDLFVPAKITNATIVLLNEESLKMETEDWNYSFNLEKIPNNKMTVEFVDTAKFGTYLAATKYYLIWNTTKQNWEIVGEEATYIDGDEEDKKIEGKYFALPTPITLLKQN